MPDRHVTTWLDKYHFAVVFFETIDDLWILFIIVDTLHSFLLIHDRVINFNIRMDLKQIVYHNWLKHVNLYMVHESYITLYTANHQLVYFLFCSTPVSFTVSNKWSLPGISLNKICFSVWFLSFVKGVNKGS
jgi:hypothetical protein